MKICLKCQCELQDTEFKLLKTGKLYSYCYTCSRIYAKLYYIENREKRQESDKRYQSKNREKINLYYREYYKKNTDKYNKKK